MQHTPCPLNVGSRQVASPQSASGCIERQSRLSSFTSPLSSRGGLAHARSTNRARRGAERASSQRDDKNRLLLCSSGLVIIAGDKLPIPSRTRTIRSQAPMVLRLKPWESRSSPNPKNRENKTSSLSSRYTHSALVTQNNQRPVAGWSSPVARQAHNLKVVGSNPTPATINSNIRSIC